MTKFNEFHRIDEAVAQEIQIVYSKLNKAEQEVYKLREQLKDLRKKQFDEAGKKDNPDKEYSEKLKVFQKDLDEFYEWIENKNPTTEEVVRAFRKKSDKWKEQRKNLHHDDTVDTWLNFLERVFDKRKDLIDYPKEEIQRLYKEVDDELRQSYQSPN